MRYGVALHDSVSHERMRETLGLQYLPYSPNHYPSARRLNSRAIC